jgi:hypothetical protein
MDETHGLYDTLRGGSAHHIGLRTQDKTKTDSMTYGPRDRPLEGSALEHASTKYCYAGEVKKDAMRWVGHVAHKNKLNHS